MNENAKAQVWFTDFVIGMIVFSLVLISYYTYTTNISKQDSSANDNLISDAKIVSSSLISKGFPNNWDVNTVTRIGFTDSYNRLDTTKFNEFILINYNKSKKLFGTTYDYILFFVNESEDVQNVEGFCATGHGLVNVPFDISAAYYYQNKDEEQFLKSFMEDTFSATIYCDGGPKCDFLPFSQFITDINNYDFIVVEHPAWATSSFNSFEDAVHDPDNPVDTWLGNGGILFVGGQLPSANQHIALSVEFFKRAGQSESDRLATVVNEDEFIAFDYADNIIFRQAYWIEDVSVGADLKDIARFNCSFSPRTCYDEIEDIAINGPMSLTRWPIDDGKIFYFILMQIILLAGYLQEIIDGSAQKFANAVCFPINISNIKRDNLVRTDRLVIYKSDQIKMVLYMWQ
ncbi:MAG: hypothetical protein IH892_06290 [Planctomycetes bacterium]|nr:hypothetical protein [Planctomycetota bacterium]